MFPVLPQPDTSKLLANLQLRQQQQQQHNNPTSQQQQQHQQPAAPQLPNVPLPNSKCYYSSATSSISGTATNVSTSSPVISKSLVVAEPSLSSSNCPVLFTSSSSSSSPPVRPTHGYFNLLKVDANKPSAPRIGPDYQAVLPPIPSPGNRTNRGAVEQQQPCSRRLFSHADDFETLMWSPQWSVDLSAAQLETYLRTCSSAAAGVGGLSAEEALRILATCRGDVFQVNHTNLL